MIDAGSAGAPKGLQSAATSRRVKQQANLQISDRNLRSPAARGSRRPTRFPLDFWSAFCLHPIYFTIDRALEVLRIRILDTSGPRFSKHYANDALRELRARILDTSGPRSSIHYANSSPLELRILILDHSGPRSSISSANYVLRATHIDQPIS